LVIQEREETIDMDTISTLTVPSLVIQEKEETIDTDTISTLIATSQSRKQAPSSTEDTDTLDTLDTTDMEDTTDTDPDTTTWLLQRLHQSNKCLSPPSLVIQEKEETMDTDTITSLPTTSQSRKQAPSSTTEDTDTSDTTDTVDTTDPDTTTWLLQRLHQSKKCLSPLSLVIQEKEETMDTDTITSLKATSQSRKDAPSSLTATSQSRKDAPS